MRRWNRSLDADENIDPQQIDKIKNFSKQTIRTDLSKHHNILLLIMLIEFLFECPYDDRSWNKCLVDSIAPGRIWRQVWITLRFSARNAFLVSKLDPFWYLQWIPPHTSNRRRSNLSQFVAFFTLLWIKWTMPSPWPSRPCLAIEFGSRLTHIRLASPKCLIFFSFSLFCTEIVFDQRGTLLGFESFL